MINFTKYGLNHQKPQNIAKSENIPSMHEKMHVNQKINEKERVQWTYRLMERKTLQKDWLKMKKKNLSGALPSRRERGKFEKVV